MKKKNQQQKNNDKNPNQTFVKKAYKDQNSIKTGI